VWEDAEEVVGCFCGNVGFLISLIASVAGDPDKGESDLDGGDGVKQDVDAVDKWMCSICIGDGRMRGGEPMHMKKD